MKYFQCHIPAHGKKALREAAAAKHSLSVQPGCCNEYWSESFYWKITTNYVQLLTATECLRNYLLNYYYIKCLLWLSDKSIIAVWNIYNVCWFKRICFLCFLYIPYTPIWRFFLFVFFFFGPFLDPSHSALVWHLQDIDQIFFFIPPYAPVCQTVTTRLRKHLWITLQKPLETSWYSLNTAAVWSAREPVLHLSL